MKFFAAALIFANAIAIRLSQEDATMESAPAMIGEKDMDMLMRGEFDGDDLTDLLKEMKPKGPKGPKGQGT